jgi:hypothetical protein
MARRRRGDYIEKMNPTNNNRSPNLRPATNEQIAALAYALWEDRGRPEGNDLDFWFEAERILKGEMPRHREAAADEIPATPGDPDHDPAVEGGSVDQELENIVRRREPRSPTAM